ncbi:MAG: hypothetical protein ACRC3Y_10575 [Romboutsia sp.]|uniref:hypothetical protein n=1 Tax=Romboutsia sp. TaxID=1965302 RepID=UPI003F38ADA7
MEVIANIVRNRVLYSGIDEYIPDNINSFTQMNIDRVLTIPCHMPDIDELLKVGVDFNIRDKKIVKTAIGTSLEGQNLTGYKLLTEGEFIVRLDFCADDANASIYTFRDNLFFNNSTTLDEDTNLNGRFSENIYIEDIYAQRVGPKEVLINISFIFTAESY